MDPRLTLISPCTHQAVGLWSLNGSSAHTHLSLQEQRCHRTQHKAQTRLEGGVMCIPVLQFLSHAGHANGATVARSIVCKSKFAGRTG